MEEREEFLASDTKYRALELGESCLQPTGDRYEYPVAFLKAALVVDPNESIDVDPATCLLANREFGS